jgi:hypothetical protein
VYRCVKEQAGRQEWEKPTGFVWGLPSVNTICDQFLNGGDIVAVRNIVLLHWNDVAVY